MGWDGDDDDGTGFAGHKQAPTRSHTHNTHTANGVFVMLRTKR
jgi:hypothetical protein